MKSMLLALPFLFLSIPASAAIVYSGLQSLTTSTIDFDGIYVNVGTGAVEYDYPANFDDSPWINIFLGGNGIANSKVVQPIAVSVGAYDPILESDYFVNLAPGTTIDVSSGIMAGAWASENHIGTSGDPGKFVLDQPGILGFAFQNVAGGNTFYGWLRFIPSNGGNATILDWAHQDTAGAGIQAGAVPEASSSVLVICGIAGMATFRRRKV